MGDSNFFFDLPVAAQAAAICFTLCGAGLFAILLLAPRRNCFFLRWRPEKRLLALVVAPALIILWPIVLYNWFLHSRGVNLDDLDFYDD